MFSFSKGRQGKYRDEGADDYDHAGWYDMGVRFGPVILPEAEVAQHVGAIGATGSGKTTIQRLYMQDALPHIRPGSDRRALIYDAKQDLLPTLAGLDPDLDIVTSNPFDARGAAWDICRDAKSPAIIAEIAVTLLPEASESQPYFINSARCLAEGVMLSFLCRGIEWTLADLLRAFRSPKLLRRVLRACPYTRHLIPLFCYDKKILGDILSTFASRMMAFVPLAASWEHAVERFSIEEWSAEEYALVLGNYETGKRAINIVNRCIFKRACDVILNQPDSVSRKTHFILDELSEMGHLDGLLSLAKKGRSKGACLFIAFQSVSGLKDKNLYGSELTEEILDQIGSFAIGRVGPDTAKWCSTLIGDEEISQFTESTTATEPTFGNGGSKSKTRNQQIVTRPAILPSELQSIPPCNIENGLTAIYLLRTEPSAVEATMDGCDLFENDLIPPASDVANFEPRDWQCELLEPWTQEQADLFAPKPPQKTSRSLRRPNDSAKQQPNPLDRMNDL